MPSTLARHTTAVATLTSSLWTGRDPANGCGRSDAFLLLGSDSALRGFCSESTTSALLLPGRSRQTSFHHSGGRTSAERGMGAYGRHGPAMEPHPWLDGRGEAEVWSHPR